MLLNRNILNPYNIDSLYLNNWILFKIISSNLMLVSTCQFIKYTYNSISINPTSIIINNLNNIIENNTIIMSHIHISIYCKDIWFVDIINEEGIERKEEFSIYIRGSILKINWNVQSFNCKSNFILLISDVKSTLDIND